MPEERDKRSQRAPEIHVPAVSEVSASLRCSRPQIGPLITARGVPAVRIGVESGVRQLAAAADPDRADFVPTPASGPALLGVGLGAFLATTFRPGAPLIEQLIPSDGRRAPRPLRSPRESKPQRARPEVLRCERFLSECRMEWLPWMIGNHVVYRCRRAAEEARALATQLGHDGQRTRAFLEKAVRVGRHGLNAAAALDDLRAARRVA